jgi:hypothetical protein
MKRILTFILFSFILFSFSKLNAQSTTENLRFGDEAFSDADYFSAAYYFKTLLDVDSSNLNLVNKYAESNRLMFNYPEAEKWYDYISRKDSKNEFPLAIFWKAEMQKPQGKYKLASENFSNYYNSHKSEDNYFTQKSKHEIESCEFAIQLMKDTIPAIVGHLNTNINSVYSDFGAVQLGDTALMFSSLRSNNKTVEESSMLQEKILAKIFKAKSTAAGWNMAKPDNSQLNNEISHNANVAFSSDHKTAIFSRCVGEKIGKLTFYLYKSEFKDGRWQTPEKLNDKINLAGYINTQPTIAVNEKKEKILYFISNRPGGIGNFDIWYSVIKNGTFNEPVNLGSTINTPGNENTPFYYNAKGTLFFSSDWHNGLGGYDVFKSFGSLNEWTSAENVGFPLNSSYNDLYYTVNENDSDGYFTSNRPGSFFIKGETCCNDIYSYEWTGNKKTKPKVIDLVLKDTIDIKEKIKELLPLTLYFHNDEPDPATLDTTTKKNYKSTLADYFTLKDKYRKEYSKGLKNKAKTKAENDIDDFFKDFVEAGFNNLQMFTEWLAKDLENGSVVRITVKGYCSPLHTTDYNNNLAKRRISSLKNFFLEYENGFFLKYLNNTSKTGGKLEIYEDAIGKTQSSTLVSDNPNDERNSVYSRAAALERRIQIIFYDSDSKKPIVKKEEAFPEMQLDKDTLNVGKVTKGFKSVHVFTFQNTGKESLKITSVDANCQCITTDWSDKELLPGAKSEINVLFDSKDDVGKINSEIIIKSNAKSGDKKIKVLANIVEPPKIETPKKTTNTKTTTTKKPKK